MSKRHLRHKKLELIKIAVPCKIFRRRDALRVSFDKPEIGQEKERTEDVTLSDLWELKLIYIFEALIYLKMFGVV
ncbi:18246_t:CDS:2 [Acaulospora morrowiae]|uniref:18246_t:CDS:1 n=1 Tax=Acaulospora morrowiae TaxID=94023 RepID=A0A9N8Z5T5_9GLOM|nr:18246_t:CDS:2 [Acaulospora morrowiae]